MVTRAEADEDERERAAWRRANGIPEPKGPGHRPPLRKTGAGASYRQGNPHVPAVPIGDQLQADNAAATPVPAPATEAPATDQGSEPGPARGPGSPSSSGPKVTAGKVTHGAAGLIVGLFAWGFSLNYIRGGWPQAAGWFGAKFFNEPYTGPKKAGASSGSSGSSGNGTPGNGKPQQAAQTQGRPNPASVQGRL